MKVINKNSCDISEIAAALKEGKTFVYPTETCYGLGCDATNEDAVRKIFQIKGRMDNKPLLILVADEDMAKEYVVGSDIFDELAKKYWPGALTIVAPLKVGTQLPPGVVSPDKTAAVRVTGYKWAHDIVKAFGKPIVSTSANLAGAENPYTSEDVVKMFGGKIVEPDILVDAGELPRCKPSTVVSVVGGQLKIIRQGEIEISDRR